MKKIKYNIFTILLACYFIQINAQSSFIYTASLQAVDKTGFYQINLQPSLTAKLQADGRDIRLLNTAGQQMPYILKTDIATFKENKFIELPIIYNKKENDKQTHIIIKNSNASLLNEILLIIKNTDASRLVTLSGSNDNKNWYVVKENILLKNIFTISDDKFIESVAFPASNYLYLKLSIIGKNVLPINIIKAGVYDQSFTKGKYVNLPAPQFIQKDSSDKCTYLFVTLNNNYFIDKIELILSGTKYYKRDAEIYTINYKRAPLRASFIIRSGIPAIFTINEKTNALLIKIYNNDNPPLQIENVFAFQLNKYLLTYLEKDKSYSLIFSDSAANAPVYDLDFFSDSIINNSSVITHGNIQKNIISIKNEISNSKINKIWMWIALIIALLVLLLLTFRLTKDINKKTA